jgi:hypothetical protein
MLLPANKFLWVIALAVVVTAWPVSVRANIGEDITQLRTRYGSAQIVGGQALFQHDGYSICVYFDGAHSGMEVFLRDGSKPDKIDFTEDDIKKVLADEGDGLPWTPMRTPNGKRAWLRSDNKLLARFTDGDKPEDKYLTIMLNAK